MNGSVAAMGQVGADIRALRKARGMTISEVASHLGKSVGWLSQVERGKSHASAKDIESLSGLFEIPVAMLLIDGSVPEDERAHVVRGSTRRTLAKNTAGVLEELLTPDLTGDVQVIHATFEARSGQVTPQARGSEEIGFLTSGRLLLTVAGRQYDLRRGDSIRLRDEPYTWENPSGTPAHAIWIISPPAY